MKKTYEIIIITSNSKIEVGNTIKYNNPELGERLYIVKDLGGYPEDNAGILFLTDESVGSIPECLAEKVELYILSDEEIKDGDWVYEDSSISKYISKVIKDNYGNLYHFRETNIPIYHSGRHKSNHSAKKIVASTDTSLNIPEIPQSYIKYYVGVNNENGKPVDYIELETGYDNDGFIKNTSNRKFKETLKLQNNEVVPVIPDDKEIDNYYSNQYPENQGIDQPVEEKIYTEEEVYKLCLQAMNDAHSLHCLPKIKDCKEWFNSKKK